jgi:hypothetical protein
MDHEATAVELLRKEIAKRLRSVCAEVPTKDFDEHVDQLARLQRGYLLLNELETKNRELQAFAEQT